MNSIRLNNQRYDAAIIDLDGTLVDTLGDFHAVLTEVLTELNLAAVDRRFVEHSVGRGSEHLIRVTLERAGGSPTLYDAAWASYQAHYDRMNGANAEVYAGVEEGLRRMAAAGLRLGCVTNKPGAFARDLLRMKGLARHFSVVYGGDAFERKKPDPLPLLKTCEALGTKPARTLMVGDSTNDAAAARAAGCPVVLVNYGYNHGEPVRHVDADGFVDRLDQIELS